MKKKHILIDWHNTLSKSIFWENISKPVSPHYKIFQKINSLLFFGSGTTVNDWMRGKLTAEDVCKIISRDLEVDYDVVYESLIESAKGMKLVSDDIPQTVARLRKNGHKVLVATDNMDVFRKHTIPALGLESMFDDFLISSELGFLKKDMDGITIHFVKDYCDKMGIEHTDILLFDDSRDLAQIYSKAGVRVFNPDKPESLAKLLLNFS